MSVIAKGVTAAQSHRCVHNDGSWAHPRVDNTSATLYSDIPRGYRYVRLSVPPRTGSAEDLPIDPLDYGVWNTFAECSGCAAIYGRAHLLAAGEVNHAN